jgi:hypothetical protein
LQKKEREREIDREQVVFLLRLFFSSFCQPQETNIMNGKREHIGREKALAVMLMKKNAVRCGE